MDLSVLPLAVATGGGAAPAHESTDDVVKAAQSRKEEPINAFKLSAPIANSAMASTPNRVALAKKCHQSEDGEMPDALSERYLPASDRVAQQ